MSIFADPINVEPFSWTPIAIGVPIGILLIFTMLPMRTKFTHETRQFQPDLKKKLEGPGGGAKVFNVHGHLMQEAGWSDLQVYSPHLPNKMIHMELKVKRNEPSTLQRANINDLRARGTYAWVVRAVGLDLQFEDAEGNTEFTVENWQSGTGIDIMQLISTAVTQLESAEGSNSDP